MEETKPHGRKFVLTEEKLQLIKDMSAKCAREKAMASALGICKTYFTEIKKRHPEIVKAIEDGRAEAEMALLDISWSIIRDGTSRERSRELDRMYAYLGFNSADTEGNPINQPLEFKFVQIPPSQQDGD